MLFMMTGFSNNYYSFIMTIGFIISIMSNSLMLLAPPRPGRSRVPSQRAHRYHHQFGFTSLIWWAVGVVRQPPLEERDLSSLSSSPLKERDTACSSHSPIKPSIEPGRSVISITKRFLKKEVFKYKGAIHPLVRLSAPLTPISVKVRF